MPPGHHSSSSHSSRSHSSSHSSHSSSSHSSRSHSHSYSHSSSSHSSYGRPSYNTWGGYKSSNVYQRPLVPKGTPSHIFQNSLHISCKNHQYIYYPESWTDNSSGKSYQKGYYDENGRYYAANEIVFKTQDGTCKTSFKCEYCGTEAEYNWNEGTYPHCSNCGAMMTRMPTYIDDIVEIKKVSDYTAGYASRKSLTSSGKKFTSIVVILLVIRFIGFMVSLFAAQVESDRQKELNDKLQYDYNYQYSPYKATYANNGYNNNNSSSHVVSNVEIYGSVIYLDEIEDNTYILCDKSDDYEKKLTWDYGADSYYDSDSDCYIWYNTDVSPNLWQYWYEDIAGSNTYGWMEYEDTGWYIETRQSYWQKYGGDTSNLWHIETEE